MEVPTENYEFRNIRDRTSVTSGVSDGEAENATHTTEIESRALAPTDYGKQAYLVLAGCTVIQAPVWGYSTAFGVFQEYYQTHNTLKGSHASVATVGTTLNGVIYLSMPIMFTALTRYPRLRPYCGPVGLFITVASLILSSFATEVWQLIASQGVLCAIGSGLLYAPTTLYLDEWFIARKGIAYGTIGAGKSAAGVVFPFLMSSLLEKYGPQTTLRVWAISLCIMTSPLLVFLKPRIPVSRAVSQRPLSWSFLKHTTFWMMQVGNVVQAFGYLLPSTYLSSYAHTIGLPTIAGAILIAVLSMASGLGSLIHGYLNDRTTAAITILVSSVGSTLAVFLLWGLRTEFGLLMAFAVVYGFFAGGFSSTYPGISKALKNEDEGIETGHVMGLLLGGRGLGFVIGGPISTALLRSSWSDTGYWGYTTVYGPVIVCTGATALLGAWRWMWDAGRRIRV
ncbi:hypothetical protein CJF32_00008061 [Rutstroemia sp. NJR-2017a WRK4]|nr:hypothetical protein CJF32_00008061 [Rutstroemia sp. NJR-2017a WRK4]